MTDDDEIISTKKIQNIAVRSDQKRKKEEKTGMEK